MLRGAALWIYLLRFTALWCVVGFLDVYVELSRLRVTQHLYVGS